MPPDIVLTLKRKPLLKRRRFRSNLDLCLKITVPLFLLVSLAISIKIGSLNGYLQIFNRTSYASFLGALGATYTLAFLGLQIVRTVLWWRYQPYPSPSGQKG